MELLTATVVATFPSTASARIPVMGPRATDTQATVAVAAAERAMESPPTRWVEIPMPVTVPATRPAVELAAILAMDVLLEAAACSAAGSSVTEPAVVDRAAAPVTELAAAVHMELDTDSAADLAAVPMDMAAV
jgi:hypothetical protein